MRKLAAFLKSCVATPFNAVLSILTALLLAWLLPELIKWSLIDAVWSGNSSKACEGHDAAWLEATERGWEQQLAAFKAHIERS